MSPVCGIVGLFLKSRSLEPELGQLTASMLHEMCDRGPDSAGFAVYAPPSPSITKICAVAGAPVAWPDVARDLGNALGARVDVRTIEDHAILTTGGDGEIGRAHV